ncbi:MAG: hypothetical protein LR015_00900, partial [Verrucomicrobia bacterium]|nr:hypothetical protein [Verrucomicrobiota bacterium]
MSTLAKSTWLRGTLFILLVSLLFAVLTAWLHPRAPVYGETGSQGDGISLADALNHPHRVLWLDARTREDWTADEHSW